MPMISRNQVKSLRHTLMAFPAPMRGVICMTTGALVLTVNDGMAKYLTESYPVGQVMALRGVSIVLLLAVFYYSTGRAAALKVNRWSAQLSRAALMTGSTICFVTGLSLLPIADAIAISFAGPLLTVALAIPFLGEKVGWQRWAAILVGFAGVLVMVQPTGDAFRVAALAPIGAAFFGAARDVMTRRMSGTETSSSILMISTTFVTVAGFCSWPFGWNPIQAEHLWIFAVSGVLVGGAQYLMIEGFRLGEVALVAPFKYTTLLWAVIIGAMFWGDIPGIEVLIGAVLVVGGGLYLLRSETMTKS
jgi:drug/metabolite transporter (DMT)-like permease